jgi:tetratricopeptide (TPR) repeat protein
MRHAWKSLGLGALLIVALTVSAQFPAMRGGFVFDDSILITNNPLIKASDGLYKFWFTTDAPDYYPLTWSLWWMEWRVWGANATGYHVVNVLLHAINAVLVWMVLRRLKIPGAWLAALVFAIHPVNVATAAWISEQKNTVSMLFCAAAILLYLRFDEEDKWSCYALSLSAFLLALLSKSAVVMLPVVLLACVWWRRGRLRWKDFLASAPFFVLALASGLTTIWFQYHRVLGKSAIHAGGVLSRLATAGCVPWFYLYKALLPVDLMVVYPRWEIDPSRWVSYVPGTIFAGCLALFWWKRQTWGRPLLFGLGCFVVMLFPVLGFFDQGFYEYSLVADHWQYHSIVAVIALAVAAGLWICRQLGRPGRALGMIVAVVVLLALSVGTWRRSGIYADRVALWRDSVTKNPKAWIAHNNLGYALLQTGELDDAIRHLEEALRLMPDYAGAHYNLGIAFERTGKAREAIGQYEQALQVNPDYAEGHNNLGIVLLRVGESQKAKEQFEQALRIDPDLAEAHNNLGAELDRQGRTQEAIGHFEQAVRAKPDYIEAHNNLASALWAGGKGNVEEAMGHWEQALRIQPDNVEAHNHLGIALARHGRIQEAIGHWEQVVRIQPGHAEAHNNLGIALVRLGKVQEAIGHWDQAIRADPDFAEAQRNLAWQLATAVPAEGGDPARAVTLARRACELTANREPTYLDTLAAAYAAAGHFDEAIATAQNAIALAQAAGQTGLVQKMEARLELYRNGGAYHRSVNMTEESRTQ